MGGPAGINGNGITTELSLMLLQFEMIKTYNKQEKKWLNSHYYNDSLHR